MKAPESKWMTVKEAAEFLGVTRPCIYNWTNRGIIRYIPDLRPRRVLKEDVVSQLKQNWYAECEAANRRRRRPRMRPYRGDGQPLVSDEVYKLCAPYGYMAIEEEKDKIARWHELHGRGEWDYAKQTSWMDDLLAEKRVISTPEAAHILGLDGRTVLHHARRGKLLRIIKREGKSRKALFSLDQVQAFADEREKQLRRRSKSPEEWKHDLLRPYIRTKIEAPPGDRLLTRSEAAFILGVRPQRVGVLVRSGRLFGFQEFPGRPGCPVYVSERQLERYATSWDRLRRRDAYFGKTKDKQPELGMTDSEVFVETYGLTETTGKALTRDYGEYFSSAQAAHELGISRWVLGYLRKRNVLLGYHIRTPRNKAGRWQIWFYRKEDVRKLKSDPQYAHYHARTKRARIKALFGDEYNDTGGFVNKRDG